MPFANFKIPAGTLTEKEKEQIITRTTDLYAEIYGERARANTLVLVEEVTDGGWGIGGNVLTLAKLQQAPETTPGSQPEERPVSDGAPAPGGAADVTGA